LNHLDACDASLQDINGLGDVSATGIFHAHRIVMAEGWMVGLGIAQSKEIFPMNRDATLNLEPDARASTSNLEPPRQRQP
jgi:hypothetical protein